MKRVVALTLADVRNITRDATLLLVVFGPLALLVFLRFAVPLATDMLAESSGFDLTSYYRFILGFMCLIPALLFGLISGLIILDECDEEIIAYIAVTPLRKTGYLAYKLLASVLASFAFFFAMVYLTGLAPLPIYYAVALAALVALEAPMVAVFLAAFAENKVMYAAPFIAYFVESDWRYLAGMLPTFWVMKAFMAAWAGDASYWLFVAVGLVVHLVFITLLLKRFVESQH